MKTLLTTCALIAVPLAAFAQPAKAPAAGAPAVAPKQPPAEPAKPAPPAAPTPAKELDVAKPYAKNWNCTDSTNAAEKKTSKLSWKLDVNKFWYAVRMDVAKSKTSPGFTGVGYVGIDPVSKGWMFVGVDNMGGWINLKAPATALTADGAVFDGEAASMMGKAPAKFTFKHDAKAKTMSFAGEFGGKKEFDYSCK